MIKESQYRKDIIYVIKTIMLALDLKTLKVPKRLLWQPSTDISITENTLTNEYIIELETKGRKMIIDDRNRTITND